MTKYKNGKDICIEQDIQKYTYMHNFNNTALCDVLYADSDGAEYEYCGKYKSCFA